MSSSQTRRSSSSSSSPSGSAIKTPAKRPPPSAPRPSSSIVLVSPTNEVLLLHRVQTSSSFASAHVFPGGNLDAFHDGDVPGPEDPARHHDGPAYRLGAVRECFEETGILLAKRRGELFNVAAGDERDAARRRIHGNETRFVDWVRSLGGVPDTDGLVPFTRWLTPTNVPKRFTTQMYVYMLPLAQADAPPSEMLVATPDNGVEHTAATFGSPQAFLRRLAANDIILFPPQAYLLHHLARFFTPAPAGGDAAATRHHHESQREALLAFLRATPTAESPKAREHSTSAIPWADKVMSPHNLFVRGSDNRVVLGLDKPGPELKGSGRGGDWEHVALVRFAKGGPSEVEIRKREDVLEEERKFKAEGSKL
ncbi:putative nudix hydrolase-like protein [Paramyrothecium foliicola]|nr:putative nudix hydrolase-like protein [Paramyrothecium foliicola]